MLLFKHFLKYKHTEPLKLEISINLDIPEKFESDSNILATLDLKTYTSVYIITI